MSRGPNTRADTKQREKGHRRGASALAYPPSCLPHATHICALGPARETPGTWGRALTVAALPQGSQGVAGKCQQPEHKVPASPAGEPPNPPQGQDSKEEYREQTGINGGNVSRWQEQKGDRHGWPGGSWFTPLSGQGNQCGETQGDRHSDSPRLLSLEAHTPHEPPCWGTSFSSPKGPGTGFGERSLARRAL